MMRKIAALAFCALCCFMGQASAQITNIGDIQAYDALGAPASPFAGQVVTVRGVLTLEKGTLNGGSHYIQDPTGGITFFNSGAPLLALGDSVEVMGTVGAFSGEIDLQSTTITFLDVSTVPPAASFTVGEAFDNDGSGTMSALDFEVVGLLAEVTGDVAWIGGVAPGNPALGSSATFYLVDGTDTLTVYCDRDTGIDTAAVGDGDPYAMSGILVNFNTLIELKPRMQADLIENPGNPFPTVADVTPLPWTPESNQAVTVSAEITDNVSIASADLFYQWGGSGGFTQVAMTNVFGDTYEATIPGTTEASIEYYVVASDNTAQVTSVPGDAPLTNLNLAVGTTSIITIQSAVPDTSDVSLFGGQLVNIDAIVTVEPGEMNVSGSQFIVEDADGGEWSGLFVFEGSGTNVLFRGDRVRISGTINEFSGTTQILPQRSDAIEVISFFNPLPPVLAYSSDVLDLTESLENVMIRTFQSAVVDTVFGGQDWSLRDAASDSSVYVDPLFATSFNATFGETMIATGMLDTRFGRNEVMVRDDNDVQQFIGVGVDDDIPAGRNAKLFMNQPNPFNPSTQINFDIPRKGMAELAVFNARGERITTLISGEVEAGRQFTNWDGRDHKGAAVGSGVYYARLRFETDQPSVIKMTLVK